MGSKERCSLVEKAVWLSLFTCAACSRRLGAVWLSLLHVPRALYLCTLKLTDDRQDSVHDWNFLATTGLHCYSGWGLAALVQATMDNGVHK